MKGHRFDIKRGFMYRNGCRNELWRKVSF